MIFLDAVRNLGATMRAWGDFASLDRLNVASEEEAKATFNHYAKHPANVFGPPDAVIPDQWTPAFQRLYYDDQGPPGLTRFFSELER